MSFDGGGSRPTGNDRLGRMTEYPFPRLRSLLGDARPGGNGEPINMSIGELMSPPPALLEETLRASAALWGKYPPIQGTPEFRRAVAGWLERRYALAPGSVDADNGVLPVSGTREALFQLALALIPTRKAGSTPVVLIPNPFYAVYEGAAVLAGAEPVFVDATRESGFLPDLDSVSEETWERTALFYLCTPSNPQGAAADHAYLTRVIGLARRYGFVLVADECYSELWLDTPPAGVLEVAKDLPSANGPWANIIVTNSLSKRSHSAGLRSGFVAGDPELIRIFTRMRGYALPGMPLPIAAASVALWGDEVHVEANRAALRARFDAVQPILSERFGNVRPAGGFYLWLDVGDGEATAKRLWTEAGVRVLPGAYLTRSTDGRPNLGARHIRAALVHDAETSARACVSIARLVS